MSPDRPGRLTTGTTAPTTDGKKRYFWSSPGSQFVNHVRAIGRSEVDGVLQQFTHARC